MKKNYVHMVGHAHIDPIWLWRWDEGLQVVISTFKEVLNLMKKFSEFTFISSSAAFYKWIEENEPEIFTQIKKRVKEGKWQIVGGWWIEPDCNIPSGESFVRQSLYGQQYFYKKFGKIATVGFNPDSFGHNWALPQILKKSGINYYIFMRPGSHEKELPTSLFWWQSQDNSKILTYRIPFSYSTGNLGEHIIERVDKMISQIKSIYPSNEHDLLCFYGVGDHGGGPSEENIKTIKKLSNSSFLKGKKKEFWNIVFSSPEKFFNKVKTSSSTRKSKGELLIPVVIDDLQYHSKGCYSAHSVVKKLNKESENLLVMSEKFASIASSLTNLIYPIEDLKKAWQNVLFCQFHDILSGTSCPESYDDVKNIYGESLSIASKTLYYSLGKIARRINTYPTFVERGFSTTSNLIPIIVFNPSSYKKIAPLELEYGFGREPIKIFGIDREEINIQQIQTSVTVGEGKKRLVFIAEVPPMGYRTYWVKKQTTESERQKTEDKIEKSENSNMQSHRGNKIVVENKFLLIELEPKTGYITKIKDKGLDYNIIKDTSAIPIVINDPSDTWSHGIEEFRDKIGTFSNAKISTIEKGPVRSRLRIENYFNKSLLVQDLILYENLPFIEFRCICDWHENLKLLKIAFQLNLKSTEVYAGIPFGYIKRKNDGKEFTAQNWISVIGKTSRTKTSQNRNKKKISCFSNYENEATYGVALITDSKYSFDVKDSEIRLTVLRSPVYAHHDPTKLKPDVIYRYQDQGINEFTYKFYPHIFEEKKQNTKNSSLTSASQSLSSLTNFFDIRKHITEVIRNVEDLHQPLTYAIESVHPGEFPQLQSFITIESLFRSSSNKSKEKGIIISAVKVSEDKSGIIIRAYETLGEKIKVKINIPFLKRQFNTDFSPHEIKTFKIPFNRNKFIKEVNLIEF